METNHLIISDLLPSTKESHLRDFFPTASSVLLARDQRGRSRCFARITFATVEAKQQALVANSGSMCGKRNAVLSLLVDGHKVPLLVKASRLPPQAKKSHVVEFFEEFADSPFVVCPMNGNLNKGYSFVYLSTLDDYMACLAQDGTQFMGRTITIVPGLFAGGRGKRAEAV